MASGDENEQFMVSFTCSDFPNLKLHEASLTNSPFMWKGVWRNES